MRRIASLFVVGLLSLLTSETKGQCPTINDGFGIPQAEPYFISCSGGSYTIFIQSNDSIGSYSIDWGDGSPLSTGAQLVPPNYVTHTYAATIDTFLVTVTETGTGCITSGVVVMEEPVNASIQIPLGGVTQVCAPGDILFVNSSTDVSPSTVFTWDFGDGTPIQTFDYTNAGDTLTHTFEKNTVSCETAVNLTAENYCSFGNPTTAQFFPIQIWDLDTAVINASATLLCYPDTMVHFQNNTIKNCLQEGNVAQRYEYWNFGDYWGLGYDSIVNWQPFDPPARPGYTLAYPGIGTYDVMLIDSNICGRDTAYITIEIVPQPVAQLAVSDDTICAGEPITFFNQSYQGANNFYWDFGNGYFNSGGANQNTTFNATGNYTTTLVANIAGGTASCFDTTEIDIHVLPSPVAAFDLSEDEACDSLTSIITDQSQNALIWEWDFGNGNTSATSNPPNQFYSGQGTYTVELKVEHANSCRDSITQDVVIYESPIAAFTPLNFCQEAEAVFTDQSTHLPGDPIIHWNWDFGNGNTSTLQNPVNVYFSAQTYAIQLLVETAYCADTLDTTLLVPPKPVADFTPSDTAGCEPLVVHFADSSSGATQYFWTFADTATSSLVQPSFTFTNPNLTDTAYTVELIVENSFGCSDTLTDQIEVYGNAIADFVHTAAPDCGPLTVDFFDASQGAIQWFWDFGDSTTSSQQNPTHTFNNNTLFINNYAVELVVTSANGCTDTTSQTITVYPEPNFPFSTVPDSGCSPLEVSFPALVGAVQYQWDFGDGTTASGQAPSHVFVNNSINNQIFTVELIATSAFGCSDTSYRDVVVFPNPTAQFSGTNTLGCPDLAVTFLNNSVGASTYQWDFGNGQTDTSSAPTVNCVFQNATQQNANFTVELIVGTTAGCYDTAFQSVTVYPAITAQFDYDTAGCSPLLNSFTNTSIGGQTYFWDFGNGFSSTNPSPTQNFIYNGVNDTTFQVMLAAESVYGCRDTVTQPLTIYNTALAAFSVSAMQGCTPLVTTFTNNSWGADSYSWDFGNGNTSSTGANAVVQNYTNNSTNPLAFDIELIAGTVEGCNDTAMQTVTVFPPISASFDSLLNGCSPLTQSLNNTSQGASAYQWNFGNNSTSTIAQPTTTWVNSQVPDTNFTVELVATSSFGCADTASESITVFNTPVADLNVSQLTGCTPVSATIDNLSTGADGYNWDFGNGQTSVSIQNTFQQSYVNSSSVPQDFIIEVVARTVEGCNDTISETLTVFPPVTANFNGDTVGCSPHAVNFLDQSIGADNYFWDFDNGLTDVAQNPIQTFTNPHLNDTVYSVTLVTSSVYGCSDTVSQDITVFNTAIAQITATPQQGCTPVSVQLTNTSWGADSYFWDFNDGTTSASGLANFSHSYANSQSNPEDYTISFIAETVEGCNDTLTETITVFPPVNAAFDSDTLGCSPLELTFTNQSSGAAAYLWNFGNGSNAISTDPSATFVYNGTTDTTYTVTLVATSVHNCSDTVTQDILVYPEPEALFTVNPTLQIYPDTFVTINNLTNGQWNTTWDFGDGQSSNQTQINQYGYNSWGEYTITLFITNGLCSDSNSQVISILPPPPEADFIGSGEGCAPLTVEFENQSVYTHSYLWEFGDGNISESEHPTYTYMLPGTYTVKMKAFGFNGQDSVIKYDSIVVHPSARAYFDFRPLMVQVPNQPVQFLNLSSDATSYAWSFGDGNTSSEESPQHPYGEIGEYYVKLVASNVWGCADSFTSDIPVVAEAGGDIEFPNVFTPNPSGPSGGYYGSYNLDNQIFYPVSEGVEDYHLMIYNRWGELVFETFELEQGWDGYYRNELCQQDVYVFRAEITFSNGEDEVVVGDLTLLR